MEHTSEHSTRRFEGLPIHDRGENIKVYDVHAHAHTCSLVVTRQNVRSEGLRGKDNLNVFKDCNVLQVFSKLELLKLRKQTDNDTHTHL